MAFLLLPAVAGSTPRKGKSWRAVALEGTPLQVLWPKGKGADWFIEGSEGSYVLPGKGPFPRSFRFDIKVVASSPDSSWDEILDQVSGEGLERMGAAVDGEVREGSQAGYPTRTWTLARRDSDGIRRDFSDVFVLRTPAHHIVIRYSYTPTDARMERLGIFQKMAASVQAPGAPLKKTLRKKKKTPSNRS